MSTSKKSAVKKVTKQPTFEQSVKELKDLVAQFKTKETAAQQLFRKAYSTIEKYQDMLSDLQYELQDVDPNY